MLFAFPLFLVGAFMALMVATFVCWILAIIEVSRTPEPVFGPPWDNGKNPWLIGLIVAMVVPAGTIVTTILWWVQGHKALREGRPVPKPFWSPARPAYYPYAYPPPVPAQPPAEPPVS